MLDDNQVLSDLIEHIDGSAKPITIGWDAVQEWQAGVLERLLATGLLSNGSSAQSLQCMGCEHHCFMDVLLASDGARAFIVCDHPDMQSQMGRINLPLERLLQWQSSTRKLARVVAKLLGFGSKPDNQHGEIVYRLGMLQSPKGRRWVLLNIKPLSLELNGHIVPLVELLYFDGAELLIDRARVDDLLNSVAGKLDNAYTPNTNKREAKKLVTQAMYQDWKDGYQRLKKLHSDKNDEWFAYQISKMDIAEGRSAGRIRKIMKM